MSRLTLRQPPPGLAQVDWESPISKGLALYMLPAFQAREDLARKTALTFVKGRGAYEKRGTEKGQSLVIANDRNSNEYTGIDVIAGRPNLSGPFTMMFYGRPSSFTSSGIQITGMISAFTAQGNNAPVLRWGNDGNSGTARRIVAYAQIGGADKTIIAPTDSVAGVDYLVIATYDGATFSLWVNGALIGSVAASGAVTVGAYGKLTIGADYVNTSNATSNYGNRHFTGDLYAVAVWERGFPFEEARAFLPYHPLRMPRRARAAPAAPSAYAGVRRGYRAGGLWGALASSSRGYVASGTGRVLVPVARGYFSNGKRKDLPQ